MTYNNPKLDPVNMNAYIKFGQIPSICSQNIRRKRNFGVNQRPFVWYKCAKKDGKQSQARSCQFEYICKIWGNSVILSGNRIMTDMMD